MRLCRTISALSLSIGILVLSGAAVLRSQQPSSPSGEAQALVKRAVDAEIAAGRSDHSLWRYKALEGLEDNSVYDAIETSQGTLRRRIEQAGHSVNATEQQAQTAKIQAFLNDPKAQAKQKRDGEHDDESAEKMLNLLPHAFLWRIASNSGEVVTLHFAPNPAFNPPDIESRVLSAMEGDLVVNRTQQRIATIRGRLTHDVNIGFGILGKLHEGGTFNVERRQVAPGIWQITETHVHIDGRALLFKTIGQQTDEIKTAFQPVPAGATLAQAAAMLAPR